MLLIVECLGLGLAAPLLLARIRNARISVRLLFVLAAGLVAFATYRFLEAAQIDRQLALRVELPFPAGPPGPRSLAIEQLPGSEGIHASLVGLPDGITLEDVRKVRWSLEEAGRPVSELERQVWLDHADRREGDGLTLFEVGDRPLKGPLTLRYDAVAAASWLEQARLRLRPDRFTLKMYPIVAGVLRLRGWACVFGAALSFVLVGMKLRRSKGLPAPAGG